MSEFSESMAWLARRDGSVIVGHGPFLSTSTPPPGETAFYLRGFARDPDEPWKIPARTERTTIGEFASRFAHSPAVTFDWSPPDAIPFSEVFQEIMLAIRGGRFEKTVPVVTETGVASHDPALAIIAATTGQRAPLRSFGWVDGHRGFAGATPELLLSLDGASLETMALAGTAKKEDRDVFAVDEKEIREHEYVAQTLVAKLLDLGRLERKARGILDLGSIVHFLTHIDVTLRRSLEPEELVDRLHPTPALGPLPRTGETLAMLIDWRNRLGCPAEFGAPFGVLDDGRFDAIVCIRALWWEGRNVMLPTGCGIIEASRLVNEWRELRLKRESVKRFFIKTAG